MLFELLLIVAGITSFLPAALTSGRIAAVLLPVNLAVHWRAVGTGGVIAMVGHAAAAIAGACAGIGVGITLFAGAAAIIAVRA